MKRPSLSKKSWALVIGAGLVVVYSVAIFIFALQYPSDGLAGHLQVYGIGVDSAPVESPVRPGDIVLAVNNRRLDAHINKPGNWFRFLFSHTSDTATYTLLRNGVTLEVQLSWNTLTPLEILVRLGPFLLIAFSFLAALVLIVMNRVDDTAAMWVALVFCVHALNLVNNTFLSLGVNLALASAWLFNLIDLLSFGLGMSFSMHALLVFPERKWLAEHASRFLFLLHGANVLISMLAAFGLGRRPLLENRGLIFSRVLYPLAAIELVVGIGHMVHTYLTSRRPGVRNRIRWLMWGTLLGPLPWLFFYNLPIALTGRPVIPLVLADISLILIPVSFVFSVTGRALIAVDTLINRSLVYTALSGVLIAFYLIAVGVLEQVLHSAFGMTDPKLASIVVIFIIALGAAPLRTRFQAWVDRAFYRRWVDMRGLMRDAMARLSTTLELDTLVAMLIDEIPTQLHVSPVLFLLHEEDNTFRSLGDTEVFLPEDHALILYLETHQAPLVLRQRRDLAEVVSEALPQSWELVLPLHSRGQLLGIYFLGPRISGELYGADEIETLALLSQQIGMTLENIRLYQRIAHYSADLEGLVAERTQALAASNEALSRERDRLSVIIDNMADGLLVTSQDARIVLVNPAFEQMVAHPQVQLIGRALERVVVCDALVNLIRRAVLETSSVFSVNCELNDRVLRASATALHNGTGTITVLRDVTHEVVVDRMKTEFISTVSHELRTPLTSVLGFTKLINKSLQRDVLPVLPPDAHKAQRSLSRILQNLDIVNTEGERLTHLINDVLDIAKMESGRIKWHDQELDIAALVRSVVEQMQPLASEHNNRLRIDIGQNVSRLFADPKRIRQVLTNLLSNALKFTDRGQVWVRVRLVSSEDMVRRWQYPEENSGGVWIAVEDTGVGIPEKEIPNLFQHFNQVREDILVNKPKGTGLGLAICSEIVTHYGGQIWVESELDRGSTFSFVLPLRIAYPLHEVALESSPVRAPEAQVETASSSQPLVLIVDDELHIRNLLKQELLEAGYQVLEAKNGVGAVAMARRYRPALILLDVMMPDISGFDVIKILKSDAVTDSIPVLILSIVEDQEHGLALGADAYLTKPVQVDVLLHTMDTLVTRTASVPHASIESPFAHITQLLRHRGFRAVDGYDSRDLTDQIDIEVLEDLFVNLDVAESFKIMRFQDATSAQMIIVIQVSGAGVASELSRGS